MSSTRPVVHRDPEILGGTPVFVGTRVPVKILFDYLEAGDSLEVFLDEFPSVTRAQAVAALELAREAPARSKPGVSGPSVWRSELGVSTKPEDLAHRSHRDGCGKQPNRHTASADSGRAGSTQDHSTWPGYSNR